MASNIPKIVIDDNNCQIVLSAEFSKRAKIYGTSDYRTLQEVRRDYPDYSIRKRIKSNPNKNTYSKLTYDKMENYIIIKDGVDSDLHKEFKELREIAKCVENGYGYPKIKKWFLTTHPEFKKLENIGEVSAADVKSSVVEMAA